MHLRSVNFHAERNPSEEHYPFNLPLFREGKCLSFSTPVTFFAGENGTGKSTLLSALCRKCGIDLWENTGRTRYENNPYEDTEHYRIYKSFMADRSEYLNKL